jgi:translation initiation factor 4E
MALSLSNNAMSSLSEISFKSSPDLNDLKENNQTSRHLLNDKWTLWAHLPHDIDWSVNSYKPILSFSSVEEAVALCETLPDKMIKNCMLFLMRQGIQPVWEDPKNRKGGCFSYKVNNKSVSDAWKKLSYSLIGETLTEDMGLLQQINGITISPKKSFCIIKIWIAVCNYQNPAVILKIPELSTHGCLFKKHIAEY